jgi:hypothetical protein
VIEAWVASSSLIDFLKSFTAPPTSLPKFFSFDVPNSKITTIAKISTCQIDNPAIVLTPILFRAITTVIRDRKVTLIFQFKDRKYF